MENFNIHETIFQLFYSLPVLGAGLLKTHISKSRVHPPPTGGRTGRDRARRDGSGRTPPGGGSRIEQVEFALERSAVDARRSRRRVGQRWALVARLSVGDENTGVEA